MTKPVSCLPEAFLWALLSPALCTASILTSVPPRWQCQTKKEMLKCLCCASLVFFDFMFNSVAEAPWMHLGPPAIFPSSFFPSALPLISSSSRSFLLSPPFDLRLPPFSLLLSHTPPPPHWLFLLHLHILPFSPLNSALIKHPLLWPASSEEHWSGSYGAFLPKTVCPLARVKEGKQYLPSLCSPLRTQPCCSVVLRDGRSCLD